MFLLCLDRNRGYDVTPVFICDSKDAQLRIGGAIIQIIDVNWAYRPHRHRQLEELNRFY